MSQWRVYGFLGLIAQYRENNMKKDPIVDGKFYPQTLQWIEANFN